MANRGMTQISVIKKTVDFFIDKMTLWQELWTTNYTQRARIVEHIRTKP